MARQGKVAFESAKRMARKAERDLQVIDAAIKRDAKDSNA